MNRPLLIGTVLAVVVVGAVGWFAADRMVLRAYREIRQETEAYERRRASFEKGAEGSRAIKIGLRDAARTMLGAEQNVVEHRLRGKLSELAERNGLIEVAVSHGRPRIAGNPADDRASKISRSLRKRLGDQTDFAVIRGRVQGVGSLEHVVAALADLRAQPWVHRVEGFVIEPQGRERTVFALKADFATIFAPDLVVAAEADEPAMATILEEDLARLRVLSSRAPFRYAPPPQAPPPEPVRVAAKPTPEPERVAPPPPPYDKWRVTGVTETRKAGASESGVVEVFLARADTGESRALVPGESVLGAVLTGASGELVWFEKDGASVVVRAGQTLAEARPADTVHSETVGSG